MSLPGEDLPSYCFGAFELDVARKELRREGRAVPIAPKPLEFLILLLRHRDRVVSRAEAMNAVWPDVRVSDATLASTLRDLRRVLEDDAQTPGFVQTARGLGFRFVAPVTEVRRGHDDDAADLIDREPFVGRAALLERLVTMLAAASGGHGCVAMLEGEPGVGKTRTLEVLARAASASGAVVCHARFPEGGAGPPYRPWAQLLTALIESSSPARLGEELGRGLPWIARLVPGLSAGPAGEAALDEDDAGTTLLLFDAVTGFLRRRASSAPLLLVLDDLHGADRSSLQLLEHLAGEIHDARILILGAYRACELDPEHPLPATLAELARTQGYARIRIEGVDLDATRALVVAATGAEPDPGQLAEIHARTDGNPFYVRELACYLAEAGPGAGRRAVPTSLCELLRGRLQRLPLRCRDTLELAAIVGREFEMELLRQATGLDVSDLTDALLLARRAGLLELDWGDTRRFRHALVQEAIQAGLPEARRRLLHRRAGEAYRRLAVARGDRLAPAAHHLCRVAEEVGRPAVEAAIEAARHAEAQLAYEEAEGLYELALGALERIDPGDHEQRVRLLLALARAQLRAGELGRAVETARSAAALARTIPRPDLAARAALLFADYVMIDSSEVLALLREAIPSLGPEHEVLRGQALVGLANALWHTGRSEQRVALAERALAIARAAERPGDGVAALLAKRHALYRPEHLSARLSLDEQALREADRRRSDAQRCDALSWRAIDLLEAGDRVAAERDVARLEELANGSQQRRFLEHPARWRATLATFEGRFADAQEEIAESVRWRERAALPTTDSRAGIQFATLLRERGCQAELDAVLTQSPWWEVFCLHVPSARAATAAIELEAGRPGAAQRLLEQLAAEGYASLDDDPELLFSATWLAEICLALGASEPAAALHARLAPFEDRFACLYSISCRGSFARYLGLLAVAAGRHDEAARCFERALAANHAIGARVYQAWTQWDYAQLLAGRDDCGRAAALAGEARATAERLGLRRLADEIDRCWPALEPVEPSAGSC